jgi:pimeloyl-ACP methyl ester carboxylesterase
MPAVISKDGTRIVYDKYGAGPGVILVGGAFQYRALDQPTTHLANLLARNFATFHYDRRGRGDSGDTKPYAVEREIEDIEALIAEAGGSAFVFGMSSGGALALRAAAHGLAIKKMALYEPPFNLGEEAARQSAERYTQQLEVLLNANRKGEAVELAMTTWGTPAEMVAGMRQSPVWSMFEAVAPTLAYDNAIMGDGSVPTQPLSSITIPTLVMDGGASPASMRQAADAAAKALKNARRQTFEGQRHDVSPEILSPLLKDFFSE